MNLSKFATQKYRWWALVFIALGLAIVIIDNSVLNVAIPYILRDLNTTFDAIQWVVSGYALIIATILITVGRLGDLFGRKRIFLLGTVLFAIGSFIASISKSAGVLFLGEALVEAIGASMMLTSSLSLLVSEFQGRERPIAFGVWGSVAGASAALGPLLGGYLTTYHSWRWSLRINVFVAVLAILGSIFIQESKSEEEKGFDWWGTLFSVIGLFSLVFALIEGRKYGWWHPAAEFSIGQWEWALANISIVPFAFLIAVLFLGIFIWWEIELERSGRSPLMKPSMFRSRGFSLGLVTLVIAALGQFGSFFILPIFLQSVLGLNAFKTGLVFLPFSISALIFGPVSGFLASKINPKIVVSAGMFIIAIGMYILERSLGVNISQWRLAPAFVIFGLGLGASSAQLTNVILSAVPQHLASEASAVNNTIRQVGTSIGIAIIGMILASSLSAHVSANIQSDPAIPAFAKQAITDNLQNFSAESGEKPNIGQNAPVEIVAAVEQDIRKALTDASKSSMRFGLVFLLAGAAFSLFIPAAKQQEQGERPPAAGH